ncbi:MAG TPA: TonB-dependent receptor [Gemmatimonadaceae bacterium]|nr:TonB-dependent receptor [Gemmatimonadaceae bacterium]
MILFAALAIAPRLAFAQERADTTRTTASDSLVQRIAPVTIVGTRTPALAGGASAVVVHQDEALAAPLEQLLAAAPRRMPFLLVRQNSRGEAELSVRGSDSRQAAVLVDGLPLSLGWDNRADLSLVPLGGARRLTLVRGLSTLLAGPNVLGGSVEVDVGGGAPRLTARGRPVPELAVTSGIDQVGARTITGRAAVPAAVRGGVLTARGGGAHHRRDGIPLGRSSRAGGSSAAHSAEGTDPGQIDDPGLRTNSDLRQADGFASLRYEGAGGAYAGVTATASRAERGVPPELHIETPRLWRQPNATRVFGVVNGGTGERETPLGQGMLELSAGVNNGTTVIESFADRTYLDRIGRERGSERTVTMRTLITHSLPLGGELRAGATHADVRYDERLDDDPASRYRQRLTSIGAESQWLAFARALLSAGMVRDAASTPLTGGKPALAAQARWGWRLGATTYAFDQSVRVHGSLSSRSRFPSLRELYSGALNRFEPNPGLRPERLLGAEVGATVMEAWAARRGVVVQTVLFHHRLDDAVVRIATPEGRFRRVNRDVIRSSGVELLASWTSRSSATTPDRWLDGLSLTGDFVAQRVRVHDRTLPAGEDAGRAEHQPVLRGSVDLGVPLPLDMRALASAHFAGRQLLRARGPRRSGCAARAGWR